MAGYHLDIIDYIDSFLHVKEEVNHEDKQVMVFPASRYQAVLNRPRLISNVQDSPNSTFHLLETERIEVNDDELFKLFGQSW